MVYSNSDDSYTIYTIFFPYLYVVVVGNPFCLNSRTTAISYEVSSVILNNIFELRNVCFSKIIQRQKKFFYTSTQVSLSTQKIK